MTTSNQQVLCVQSTTMMKHSEPPERNSQLTNIVDSIILIDSALTAIEVTQT